VPVYRYRSIEEMPRPWRSSDDPENLRLIAEMLVRHRSLVGRKGKPGVRHFRSWEEMNAADEEGGS
jgi:hypothetical protein